MNLTLGYYPGKKISEIIDGEIVFNIFPFLESFRSGSCVSGVEGEIKKIFFESDDLSLDQFVLNYEALFSQLRRDIEDISKEDFSVILNQISALIRIVKTKKINRKVISSSVFDSSEAFNYIYRFGNVELRVLYSYLYLDSSTLESAFLNVWSNRNNSNYMLSEDSIRESWLCSKDAEFNIRRLCTNAGYYFSEVYERAWSDFIHFCDSYKTALQSCDALLSQSEFYPFSFMIEKYLKKEKGESLNYTKSICYKKFFSIVSDKRVLFLTPFSDDINDLFATGDLFNLYQDYRIPDFYIKAIPAYISTYPNKPHESFGATCEELFFSIDQEFSKVDYDVFLSTCGSYGSLVSNYVSEKYNCKVMYLGNVANTFLGIRQKTNVDFVKRNLRESFCRISDLNKYKGLELIDGGRYCGVQKI